MKRNLKNTQLLSLRSFNRASSGGDNSRFACLATSDEVQDTNYNWRTGQYETTYNALDMNGMRTARIRNGLQLIQDHRQFSVDNIFGVTDDYEIRNGELLADFNFSSDESKQGIITDVQNGIIRNFSISFQIHRRSLVREDEDTGIKHYSIDDWEPLEVSLVTVGADAEATRRSFFQSIIGRDKSMSKKNKGRNKPAHIPSNPQNRNSGGGDDNGTDGGDDNGGNDGNDGGDDGNGSDDGNDGDGNDANDGNDGGDDSASRSRSSGTTVNRSANGGNGGNGGNGNGQQPAAPETAARYLAAATRLGAPAEDAVRAFDNKDVTYESFVDDLLSRDMPTISGSDVQNVDDEKDKFVRGGSLALLAQHFPKRYKLDEGNQFRGMGVHDLMREALELNGQSSRGLNTSTLIDRSLHTTSDFVQLMDQVVNTTIIDNYRELAPSFQEFGNRTTNSDFRKKNTIGLGDLPDLQKVNEHGEYHRGTFSESGEGYAISTYGIIIGFTRQLMINDQTGELMRLLNQTSRTVARLEGDVFWGALLGWNFEKNRAQPYLLADGKPLFDKAHDNLKTGADTKLSVDSLRDVRTSGWLKKTLDGKRRAPVTYDTLIVPPELESQAEKLTQLTFNPSNVADAIPDFVRSMRVIVEPRLQELEGGETAYFLVDSEMSGLDYAFLSGEEEVFTDQRVGFDVDGIEFKIRHDFGAGVTDATGVCKLTGV